MCVRSSVCDPLWVLKTIQISFLSNLIWPHMILSWIRISLQPESWNQSVYELHLVSAESLPENLCKLYTWVNKTGNPSLCGTCDPHNARFIPVLFQAKLFQRVSNWIAGAHSASRKSKPINDKTHGADGMLSQCNAAMSMTCLCFTSHNNVRGPSPVQRKHFLTPSNPL